jgi:hypothetical protein
MLKKGIFLLAFLISSSIQLKAQTACDSLIIDCCNFDLLGNDSISLFATNLNNGEIFDYPGFILLDQNGDTLAIETVNYFGIGQGGQTHVLQVQNPIIFPFTGTLELWGGFYDTLYCSYPISFLHLELNEKTTELMIFPNPSNETIYIGAEPFDSWEIIDLMGSLVKKGDESATWITISDLKSGSYLLKLKANQIISTISFIKN